MASHPDVVTAATDTIARSGFGAGSSRLLAGTFPEHQALERVLADLVQLPAALLFPSGYQANLGAITAIAGPQDLIVADRAVHASLIDACRLSRAKLAFYPHLDVQAADKHLSRLGPRARRRILLTESLFSMDGDVAPLPDLARLACSHDAILYVDEAHAIGTLGPSGRGLCAAFRLKPDVLVGTLGKAIGASGAFVAGSTTLQEYLVNCSRPFIFTTALPPPVAAAGTAGITIALSEEGNRLRHHLHTLVAHIRSALDLPPDPIASPILPILLGDNQLALDTASRLRALGFFVPAIRPPTVREGTARLRISLSALHSTEQVSRLCHAIAPCFRTSTPAQTSPSLSHSHPRPAHSSPLTAPPGLFIAGTDTSVGKTAVAQGLLHLLSTTGHRAVPFKPVETGAPSPASDSALLRAAAQRQDLPLLTICPFSFPDPIAPAAAAARAGFNLTMELLLERASHAAACGHPVLVESAGGLLSPYAPGLAAADLASALHYPLLLVARNSLGTVSHTALAVREIRRRHLPLVGVILVDTTSTACPSQASNSALIEDAVQFAPLGTLPWIPDPTPSKLAQALQANIRLDPILAALTT